MRYYNKKRQERIEEADDARARRRRWAFSNLRDKVLGGPFELSATQGPFELSGRSRPFELHDTGRVELPATSQAPRQPLKPG